MPRDASATRARLLAAAREEFAAHGIGGARVDRIATRANVNKERIYGHFGSKEKLFDAVVTEAKSEHAEALGQPSGDLAEWVGRLYDYHRDHPVLLRLMLWEALHYGAAPVTEEKQRVVLYDDKVEALADALGTDATPESAATLLVLIGLAAWPHAMPQLTRFILNAGDDNDADAAVRQRVVDFARRSLP